MHANTRRTNRTATQTTTDKVSSDVNDGDEDDDASSVYSEASDDTRVVESKKRVGVYNSRWQTTADGESHQGGEGPKG